MSLLVFDLNRCVTSALLAGAIHDYINFYPFSINALVTPLAAVRAIANNYKHGFPSFSENREVIKVQRNYLQCCLLKVYHAMSNTYLFTYVKID